MKGTLLEGYKRFFKIEKIVLEQDDFNFPQ